METEYKIVVLGGGPAGGATALGLKKLGYQMTVIAEPRPFKAVEGISERVVEGLRNAGFTQALANLPQPSPRNASWNGATNSANTEMLINRSELDSGILQDLQAAGVEVITGRAAKVSSSDSGHEIEIKDSACGGISADFLVEARGRSAPAAGLDRLRGSETVSLLQYWQGEPCKPQSAAESFEDGWAWMAAWSDGTRYLQVTFDVATADLPDKAQLIDHCNNILSGLSSAQPFLETAEATGVIHARTSTPVLCKEAIGANWIRVGDAAMAVDPLSGNGIFQALSSALQAPAVINTLLKQPAKAELAKQFYQQRVNHLFFRFARIGRDFYASEERYWDNPFWATRRNWPDVEPLHQDTDPDSLQVVRMPVVSEGLIEEQDVVITNDQPLGIWHLNGIAMAPVVKALQSRGDGESVAACLEPLGLSPELNIGMERWLVQNNWIRA
ncbi:flavin-dependent monooxygenase QhpG [Amphritea balenae]|uniref:FAD-dependent oxidoreductase n=1 Tax=Amphritea balenae TaxID=452629 RepID=A0A3P1SIV6_9GAMM|nr:FAD-dependent monooxygenase [Amphritea balenae]RRC97078.1 FAD-dependent oxidoreductase [Amphritea balenae]GGK67774.1 alkylhalidase-like protein [Amphritea balenae]